MSLNSKTLAFNSNNNSRPSNGKVVTNGTLGDSCYFMEPDALIGKFEEVGDVTDDEDEIMIKEESLENGKHLNAEDFSSGQYNFECSLCMFTTSDEIILKEHMLQHINGPDLDTFVEESHNGENYTCLFCPFSSVSSEMLKYHIRFKHSSTSTIECSNSVPEDSKCSSNTNAENDTKSNKYSLVKEEPESSDHGEKARPKKRKRTEKKKFSLVEEAAEYPISNKQSVPVDNLRKCRKCNFKCVENAQLTEHFDEHHPQLLNYCQKCTYMTPYYSTFMRHLESHKKDELAGIPINPIYQPKFKRKGFTPQPRISKPAPIESKKTKQPMAVLKKSSVAKNLSAAKHYQCDLCSFQSPSRNHYIRHERIHTGEKPFSCPHCDYCSNQSSTMTIHIRRHTGEKPYQCSLCPFRTHSTGDLTNHVKKHDRPEESYFCEVCYQIFFSHKGLEKHRLIHEDEQEGIIKPVKIRIRKPEEPVTPPASSSKKRHRASPLSPKVETESPEVIRVPNNTSLYKCSICGFTCEKFLLLSEHCLTHKGDINVKESKPPKHKKYSCKICLIFFDSRKEKKKHKKAFHRNDNERHTKIEVDSFSQDSD